MQTITIKHNTLSYSIDVKGTEKVLELKNIISKKTGILAENFCLKLHNIFLLDDSSISKYKESGNTFIMENVKILIHVRINDKNHEFYVNEASCIKDLMTDIVKKIGPANDMFLSYNGRKLIESDTLLHSGVRNKEVIVVRMETINITIKHNTLSYSIDVKGTEKIREIKNIISEKTGIMAENFCLKLDNIYLLDDCLISKYKEGGNTFSMENVKILIYVRFNGKDHEFIVNESCCIKDFMANIIKKAGLAKNMFLFYNGRKLIESDTLLDSGVKNNEVIVASSSLDESIGGFRQSDLKYSQVSSAKIESKEPWNPIGDRSPAYNNEVSVEDRSRSFQVPSPRSIANAQLHKTRSPFQRNISNTSSLSLHGTHHPKSGSPVPLPGLSQESLRTIDREENEKTNIKESNTMIWDSFNKKNISAQVLDKQSPLNSQPVAKYTETTKPIVKGRPLMWNVQKTNHPNPKIFPQPPINILDETVSLVNAPLQNTKSPFQRNISSTSSLSLHGTHHSNRGSPVPLPELSQVSLRNIGQKENEKKNFKGSNSINWDTFNKSSKSEQVSDKQSPLNCQPVTKYTETTKPIVIRRHLPWNVQETNSQNPTLFHRQAIIIPDNSNKPFSSTVQGSESGSNNITGTGYMTATFQALASSTLYIIQLNLLLIQLQSGNFDYKKLDKLKTFIEILKEPYRLNNLEGSTNELAKWLKSINGIHLNQMNAFQFLSFLIDEVLNDIGNENEMPLKNKIIQRFSKTPQYNKIESYLALTLQLSGDFMRPPGVDLNILIHKFFNPMRIDDDANTRTYCLFDKTPDVLILHIDAIEWSQSSQRYVKPKYYIEYHSQLNYNFEVGHERFGSGTELVKTVYQLVAVVEHVGSVMRGNYVTYKNSGRYWYRINDRNVNVVTFNYNVVPHIMIYEKLDDRL